MDLFVLQEFSVFEGIMTDALEMFHSDIIPADHEDDKEMPEESLAKSSSKRDSSSILGTELPIIPSSGSQIHIGTAVT
ncbi:hypothetical protein EYF80_060626 [Liparis tanakae]|uniref:Uncharacterized protein n=1 Tax=Liparis tanakae TaxID=230148 RepID=A0A4Z2EKE7_9TELE|nr:hypothetical protein EYF80_060626 [Liparis tanakae]